MSLPPSFSPTELARKNNTGVAIRHDVLVLSTALSATAADGHGIDVRLSFGVRVVDRPADITLFKEQLMLQKQLVTLDDVRQKISSPLGDSFAEFCARHDAAACLRQRATLSTLLLDRANDIGFGLGLEFLPPVDVALRSESLERDKSAAVAHRRSLEVLRQAGERLAALGGAPAGLLPPEQLSGLVTAIFESAEILRVYLVAGSGLFRVDPEKLTLIATEISHDVGPLRCVRLIDHRLAIGGQRGVSVAGTASAHTFETPGDRGISSILRHAATGDLLATHGRLGLLIWPGNSRESPRVIPITDARFLTTLDATDERVLLAGGPNVLVYDGSTTRVIDSPASAANVICLSNSPAAVVVVRESGRVTILDRTTLVQRANFDVGQPVHGACVISQSGLTAVLISTATAIECRTLEGVSLARWPVGNLKMLTSSGRWVIGASADRASLVLLDAAMPGQTPTTISVLAQTGHRVNDVVAIAGALV